MKKDKIAELKNQLSRYLDHVRSGESVLVLDRDQPIAQIIPLARPAAGSRGHDGRLARLVRAAGAPRAQGRDPPRVWGPPRVAGEAQASPPAGQCAQGPAGRARGGMVR